jgi:aspartate/methionine/tyrosine aminotransferase
MLAEIGVATTPGRDFDPIHGDDWLRISFAGSSDDIAEAAARLTAWLPKQRR